MASLKSLKNLAAVAGEIQEKQPRSGQSRDTSAPRTNEENITQGSEDIEGRVTKKLSRISAWRSPAFWVLCLS